MLLYSNTPGTYLLRVLYRVLFQYTTRYIFSRNAFRVFFFFFPTSYTAHRPHATHASTHGGSHNPVRAFRIFRFPFFALFSLFFVFVFLLFFCFVCTMAWLNPVSLASGWRFSTRSKAGSFMGERGGSSGMDVSRKIVR